MTLSQALGTIVLLFKLESMNLNFHKSNKQLVTCDDMPYHDCLNFSQFMYVYDPCHEFKVCCASSPRSIPYVVLC